MNNGLSATVEYYVLHFRECQLQLPNQCEGKMQVCGGGRVHDRYNTCSWLVELTYVPIDQYVLACAAIGSFRVGCELRRLN
jgi:hypothetical protein